MSEFKAQILGILIVLAVFAILIVAYEKLAEDTIGNVSNKISEVVK